MVKMFLQVIVKILCLLLASGNIQAICNDGEERDPQAPACLDDCAGRRFFLDRDGICKMCVQCEPGYEHDKDCGNGENGNAVCIPCPEDHYSYNLYDCVACRVCENTKITQGCSPSTDRQCGECLPGFYKDPQNPDLCNQRCEWHSNPDTIPSCQAWLANQQGTTLSAVTSQMSSLPDVIDEGNGRVSLTLIIIILLVIVLIGGSVIPVYLCCKHCRHGGMESRDIETFREHLEPGDVHPGLHSNVGACGINGIGIARPMADEASEVGIILNDISSTSNFQMNRDSDNGDSYIAHINVEACEAGRKNVDGISENKSSSYPSSNSHYGKSGKPPLEISEVLRTPGVSNEPKTVRNTEEEDAVIGQDKLELRPIGLDSKRAQVSEGGAGDDEEDGNRDQPHECRTLLSGAPLRSKESTVFTQVEHEHMPMGADSKRGQPNEGGAGDDKENDGKEEPDEHQRLLPHTQDRDHDGGAKGGGDEEWRGSAEAEAEITPPTKRKKKKGHSRTKSRQPSAECGMNMKNKPNIIKIGHVGTLVMGDQFQYHYNNSAEHPPQGSNEDTNEEDEDSGVNE